MAVPDEVLGRLQIDATAIYNEADLWIDDLFDFSGLGGVLAKVTMPIARVLVDANRAPEDLTDPDGPVKSHTSYGEQIYSAPLSTHEQRALRDRYWQSFHTELAAAIRLNAPTCRLMVDCHNMAQFGPAAYADPGAARPLICLANLGDERGEPAKHGFVTCPPALLRAAGELAVSVFGDMNLLEPSAPPPPVVQLNSPFPGGWILRHYRDLATELGRGRPAFPIIMVEVNRGLIVGRQHPRTPIAAAPHVRLADIRQRLARWTVGVLDMIEQRAGDWSDA
jgi:N-formylglutamate deformylase